MVLWILGSLLLGAILVPWLYRAGMAMGRAAAEQELSGPVEWIGAAALRSDFPRFFSRALTASAIGLLPLLFWRIRRLRTGPPLNLAGKARYGWGSALGQIGAGGAIAAVLLLAMGWLALSGGAFEPKPEPPDLARLLKKALVPALSASLIEEWLFRGVLLGLWLRFSKPRSACLGTAAFFAFVHFLEPPEGSFVADPAAAMAGFDLLGKILLNFADPLFFITDFASLFFIGVMLAWARLRTGALWFPIGLHAGWVLAFKGFNLFYRQVPGDSLHPWAVGGSLKTGLLPLVTLALTAVICHFAMKRIRPVTPA